MEDLARPFGGLGEEDVERAVVLAGLRALPEVRVLQPLEHRSAFDDASHEQRRLGTDAEHYLARPVPVQFLRSIGRLGDVAGGVAGAVVPQLGRQPHLQATVERMPACGHQPAEVLPADPYRVAVQIVPDDLQLTARFFG